MPSGKEREGVATIKIPSAHTLPSLIFIPPVLLYHLLQPVGQALIYALQIGLKEKFTDEVKTAWVTLYTVVQHLMTLGMNEGIDA